ncbi:MerR family transcriptional regulator [Staphylococcus equorum]|uniref:MerR family transcriptional regulator n=1 Tax=Staphylococcus equorum TaxID=246432 RepID=UPI003FD6E8AB
MKQQFSPKDIAHITGVSTRTLHYYHEIGLLIPNQVYEQGYRSYNMENLTKLQHILFLRALELTLEEIKQYFEGTINEKNKILSIRYEIVLDKRNQFNRILEKLDEHFKNHSHEALDIEDFSGFDLTSQYEREAYNKYKDFNYYKAFEQSNARKHKHQQQSDNDKIKTQLEGFFDKMNQLQNEGITPDQAADNIEAFKHILSMQVPNCDNQFIEYMALTYEQDERFIKNINKNRNDDFHHYLIQTIRIFVNKEDNSN